MPGALRKTEQRALRNIKIYNWSMFTLIVAYTAVFLFIYFTKEDTTARVVLSVNLGKSISLLIIYLVTVMNLFRKLKLFPESIMKKEITSIKRQFLAFLIGSVLQVAYMSYIITRPKASFILEIFRTLIVIVTFLAPIYWIIFAHYLTFKGMKQHQASSLLEPVWD